MASTVLYAAGTVAGCQVAVSVSISLIASVGMARLAGVIYGRAILQTGGRLRVRQVLQIQRS